jgi:putative ABC transport system permease protein
MGYFRALRIPLAAGRLFDTRDADGSAPVALINRAMARRFWPGENPLGRTFSYEGREQGNRRRIVGIVADLRHFGLDRDAEPEFYTPQPQQPSYHTMTVVVRAATDPGRLLPALRRTVAELDPLVPLFRPRTLSEAIASDIAAPRLRTAILAAFAALALLLAMVGIYGVLSFTVGQRTREIGIRKALGASRRDLLRLLLSQTMAPALVGIALGLGTAALATRALTGLLFGVAPTDPLLFTVAPALLAAAALLASYLPTRRAAAIEPRVALQSE